MAKITAELELCIDCAIIVANGCDDCAHDWPHECHGARMVRGFFVLAACAEDCDLEHEHRSDDDFSRVRCDGCGTTLAGARFPAVEFAP